MMIITAIFLLGLTWTAWASIGIYRNYKLARTINLPIILSPTGFLNPLWIIAYKLIWPQLPRLIALLPLNLGQWAKYTCLGWQFDDKHAAHDELGPAFVVCSPNSIELHLADPKAVQHVLGHRKEFIKPAVIYDGLNMFGKNVDTVEGELWQKHRKITAPSFNEGVSSSVWSESIRQANEMLNEWLGAKDGTRETTDDTAHLTLHVFTYAGFGIQYPFRSTKERPEPPHRMTYQDALGQVIRGFTLLLIFPMAWMKWRIWPAKIQRLGLACDEYQFYLEKMVEREKQVFRDSKVGETNNLLNSLVQASQAQSQGLDDDELYGNLFVYNMAGHETTANVVAAVIVYLAQAPKWQDWIHEEISSVLTETDEVTAGSYHSLFPKLKRCQALMLETLRLTGSVSFIPKAAAGVPRTIVIDGTPHVVPTDTFVITNVQALHTDPRLWGEDVMEWRPDRWLRTKAGTVDEELIESELGTYVPWSEGQRECPGKKFSQVEFTAVMATLFRRATVAPKPEGGETAENARRRAKKMVDDMALTGITLQMTRPRDVAMMWKLRQ